MKKAEDFEPMKFIKILVAVVIFLGLIYYFTSRVVVKNENNNVDSETATVTKNETIIGLMLSRPEKEYYVLLYTTEDDGAATYDSLQENYLKSTTATKLYYVNMYLAINEKYLVESDSNPKATELKDMKIKSGTLLKVENNKITEYIEGYTDIYKQLNK